MPRARVVVLVTLLLGPMTAAEEPEARNVSAESLVARHLEARGGAEVLGRVRTLRQTGRLIFNGRTYPLTICHSLPNRYRIEWVLEGGRSAVEACDGTTCWQQNIPTWEFHATELKLSPLAEMPAERAVLLREDEADFEGPLVHYRAKGHRLELVGSEDVDGTAAYHLRVTLASGRVQDFYLDRERFTVVRKTAEHYANKFQGFHRRSWYYVDYRQVSGLLLPVVYEREDIQLVSAFEIDRVEINVELDDSLFALPKAPSP